ncbi:MFS transporter [Nocardioides sp. LHG3406-4]|uniref:MFS transporter n=1 Tax=Nocardioides sp. LHG3406-4 TaxID=2804575 RepID=UPI003CE87454
MRTALRSTVVRRFALAELLLQVQFWFPIWFVFLRDLGFSFGIIVLADALFRLTVVVCEIPLGMLTDRVGRRGAYLALSALTGLTFVAITTVRSTPVLMGVWLLWGVQWAAASGLGQAYLVEAVREHAPSVGVVPAFGVVRAAAGLTGTLSLASAGVLYGVDPRLPFLVTAACAMAALLVIATLPRVTTSLRARQQSHSTRWQRGALREIGEDRALVRRMIAAGLVLLYGWSATLLFQPLVLDEGMDEQAAAWMFTGFAAAGLVAGLVAPAVVRALGNAAVAGGFGLMVVASAGVALGSGPTAVLFVPLMGLGYYGALTISEATVSGSARTSYRATALSVVSSAAGLAIAAARPVLGSVADARSTEVAFAVWAVVGGVLLLVLVGLLRTGVREVPVEAEPSRLARP